MKNEINRNVKWRGKAILTALVIAGSVLALNSIADARGKNNARPVQVVVDNTPIDRAGQTITSFAPVVKDVSPSVVNIFTRTKAREVEMPGNSPGMDPWLRRFFGDQFSGPTPRYRTPEQRGLGSGVIVSPDGYILTNNHVVENADIIEVSLNPDGREYQAEVIGRDPKTDLAVLKIKAEALPYIKLADSEQLEIGDLVLAIGNPFGIGQTVTMGIVSATGRANMGLDYEDFIQTDAAINPGNSGGALVDVEGRLLGINTAILSRSGGNQGIGFAIPINMARNVMESLIENGRVERGLLGVMIQDVTPELAKAFDLDRRAGALVSQVNADSAAEKAGIQSGDVILEFNGEKIKDSRQLKLAVGQTPPYEKVEVKLNREGKEKVVQVTLASLEDDTMLASNRDVASDSDGVLTGVAISDLDNVQRRELRIPERVEGVVVSQVRSGSNAAEAGLRPGDVILEIDRQPVESAREAVKLSRQLEDDAVLLKIWSRGGSRFLVVESDRLG